VIQLQEKEYTSRNAGAVFRLLQSQVQNQVQGVTQSVQAVACLTLRIIPIPSGFPVIFVEYCMILGILD
jgi:hypothetical protein